MAVDPASLLAQAACYNCYGSLAALELALYAQWAAIVTGGNPANLIPPGSVYSPGEGGIYQLSAVIGGVYQWTRNANDLQIIGNNNTCTSTCTITADAAVWTLVGVSGAMVTAVLVRIS